MYIRVYSRVLACMLVCVLMCTRKEWAGFLHKDAGARQTAGALSQEPSRRQSLGSSCGWQGQRGWWVGGDGRGGNCDVLLGLLLWAPNLSLDGTTAPSFPDKRLTSILPPLDVRRTGWLSGQGSWPTSPDSALGPAESALSPRLRSTPLFLWEALYEQPPAVWEHR